MSGQRLFDNDAIVIRVARRVGTGENRTFYVSAFDAVTGTFKVSYVQSGAKYDLFDHPGRGPS